MREFCPMCMKRGVRWVELGSSAEQKCLYCAWSLLSDLPEHSRARWEYLLWEVNHLACDQEPIAQRVSIQPLLAGHRVHSVHLLYKTRWYRVAVTVPAHGAENASVAGNAEVLAGGRKGDRWMRCPSWPLEYRLRRTAAAAVGAILDTDIGDP